jgi:hypothetical protein
MRVKHSKLNKFRNAIRKGDEIKDTVVWPCIDKNRTPFRALKIENGKLMTTGKTK